MKQAFSLSACAAIAAFLAAAPPATAEIGVLAAVNRDMTGARPSEAARPLFIKEQLVSNELIETTTNGGGQVLFLDQTSLTIAPNSSIVLDKYVYDPDANTGEIGITVARGALRLIGGRITKTSEATIKTPSATIGIRGGIGSTNVGADGATRYVHLAGISSTITTAQGFLTITREGGYAEIGVDGALEYLGVAPPEVMASAVRASTGSGDGGSSGGGDASAQIGQVTAEVSQSDGAVQDAPISTQGERQSVEFAELPVELTVAPDDDLSDANLMDDLGDDLVPGVDGVAFSGLYAVTASTVDGTFTGDLPFNVFFSPSDGQGIANVGIPVAGADVNLAAPNPQTQELELVDSFVVVSQGTNGIVNEQGLPTVLLGDVNASFTVNAANALSGNVSLNYENGPSIIQGTFFADGVANNIPGVNVPDGGTIASETADALREVLTTGVTEPGN